MLFNGSVNFDVRYSYSHYFFSNQVDKLRIEREERARAGAPTPPSPLCPPEPVDTRHILQPVERGKNPDSPENNCEATTESESGESSNGVKKSGEKEIRDEKDEMKKANPEQVRGCS